MWATKTCAQWVPRILTPTLIQKRVDTSQQFVLPYERKSRHGE
jgi:hypothetical protein